MTQLSYDGSDDPTPAPTPDAVSTAAVAEVALTGELDLATYDQAQERVDEVERSRPALLVIDLAALEFMDSTGVRLVLRAEQRAKEQGRRVAVRLGTGSAMRVFQTLGLLDVLEVVANLDDGAADGKGIR
jgi:stage II sporulation protein AA (anti-sigma F factor antagonist)